MFEDGEKKLFLYNRFITTPPLLNAIKSKLSSLPYDIDIGPDLSKVSDLKVLKARNGRLVLYRGDIPTKRVFKTVPFALFLINAIQKSRQVGKSINRHPVLGFISHKTEHINDKDKLHSCWNKLLFFFCFSS